MVAATFFIFVRADNQGFLALLSLFVEKEETGYVGAGDHLVNIAVLYIGGFFDVFLVLNALLLGSDFHHLDDGFVGFGLFPTPPVKSGQGWVTVADDERTHLPYRLNGGIKTWNFI